MNSWRGKRSEPSTGRYDAIVIGGGHNGLVCAAYLSRAGRRTLVLERRPRLGGAAADDALPGFTFSTFSHAASTPRPEIIRDLALPRHGLRIMPLGSTVTPLDNGDYLANWGDADETRRELERHSPRDAEAAERFETSMRKIAMAMKPILGMVAPDPASPAPSDLRALLTLRRHVRALGAACFHELYKLMTMSISDYLDEWYEFDPLKASMAASGIAGAFLGPRSPGSAYGLLRRYLGETSGASRAWGFQRGCSSQITEAIASAALEQGAEIRTGAPVARVLVSRGSAGGVALENGDEIRAPVIVSSLDPRRTFLQLVERRELPDELVAGVEHHGFHGSAGRVNLALGGLPRFACLQLCRDQSLERRAASGSISISPSVEYLERAYDHAKYGEFSRRPHMDIIMPSMMDPGMAPPRKHVMSVFVQYVPYHLDGGWNAERREAFGDTVVDALARYAPNIRSLIIGRHVLTPADIERTTGHWGGTVFSGDIGAHGLFLPRPEPRFAKHRTPIRGYWQCGTAMLPGGGAMGESGRLAALEITTRATGRLF